MTVGGKITNIKPVRPSKHPKTDAPKVQILVQDTKSSTKMGVFAEIAPDMPAVGDEIWWQAGKIYFDGDKKYLKKVGYSWAVN